MATPNYSYEKRQKELAKKRKKEDKLKKKSEDKPDDVEGDASNDVAEVNDGQSVPGNPPV